MTRYQDPECWVRRKRMNNSKNNVRKSSSWSPALTVKTAVNSARKAEALGPQGPTGWEGHALCVAKCLG